MIERADSSDLSRQNVFSRKELPMDQNATRIRELDESDISSILARNSIGRLAFLRGDEIDVIPIQYVYREGSIYGRTSPDGKLTSMDPNGTVVAFEVDEIGSSRQWRTVLAHGTLRVVARDSGEEEWLRALGMIRRLQGAAFRQDDPSPNRTALFRIAVTKTTGRALG
jgi:nitroimidazol reductase NimA-like FMN-containing flavoprotein (pyridoxamine 5'-phosphate oxidase superfamily)